MIDRHDDLAAREALAGATFSNHRALAQVYASDAIVEVFRRAFGPSAKPSPALVVMYGLNAYPE